MMYAIDGMEDIQTVVNSFRRVQQYLLSPERKDYRAKLGTTLTSGIPSLDKSIELPTRTFDTGNSEFVASVKDASARYASEDEPTVRDLTFQIVRCQTTMIYGQVGSGKSTLLRLLLGEMPLITGSVSTSFSTAAYCPQSPWCIRGTIRDNIVGVSDWDEKWYNIVVSTCALNVDITELSFGDQTTTGTKGSRLSGGQQIRVSLARALYSRHPIIILDDVVTGLDRNTEQHILNAVFGPDGLLKRLKSTVILTTTSAHHLRFSDHIIFLDENGTISRQGPFENCCADEEEIQKLESPPRATMSKPEPEVPEEALQELDMLEDPDPRVNRKAGDVRIYAYYASIAGWWLIVVYLIACAIFVFGMIFPCKLLK